MKADITVVAGKAPDWLIDYIVRGVVPSDDQVLGLSINRDAPNRLDRIEYTWPEGALLELTVTIDAPRPVQGEIE